MKKQSAVYRWLVVLGVLVTVGILLKGIVGAQGSIEVALGPTEKSSYLLGETVNIPGYVDFAGGDPSAGNVTLVIQGPQSTTLPLPIAPGTHLFPEKNLEVSVVSMPTGLPSTLPSTLPFFEESKVVYDIKWTPPIFLDPAPPYSLIPETTGAFSIPQYAPPTPSEGGALAELPDTAEEFEIPLVGTPAPGQPAALPSATSAFPIPMPEATVPEEGAPAELPTLTQAFPIPSPEVEGPEEGAPAELPTLTEAFSIPMVPTPAPEEGAPADLPTLTEAFSIPLASTPEPEAGAVDALPTMGTVFTIPAAPTPTPIAGVAELPSATEVFDIPGGKVPQGLTFDGTYFYILVDGSPADQILKVDSSGNLDTTWGGGDGIINITLGGQDRNNAEGIAYLDSVLYVSDTGWYDDWDAGTSGNPMIKFNASDGSYDSYFFTPDWQRFSGLHSDGTRLWAFRKDGGQLYKMSKLGVVIASPYLNWPYTAAGALAVGSGDYDYLFGVEGESIVRRSKTDGSLTGASWTVEDSVIRGLTYSGGVLYYVDAESLKLYKAQAPHGQEVTTHPRGLAYDGAYLYILLDATPKDKIVVVDPADTSDPPTIIRSFDAPSSKGDALAYFDGFLWLGQVDGCCTREIKKLEPIAGNVVSTLTMENPIWNDLGGLANNGTKLVGFTTNDRGFYTISKTDGSATRKEGDGEQWGFDAGAYRITSNRAYGAKDNQVFEFDSDGKQLQVINLPADTTVKGLTFIGPNLYIADDDSDTIYRGSIPHGITVSTDPLAMAYNGTDTLFVLTDGTPRDKILLVDPTSGSVASSYNAPDDSGEGLTYLGTSLYYASNKDNNRRIYQLNPTTGAELASFYAKDQWGNNTGEVLRGLGSDGTDLFLSATNQWDPCIDKINKTNGNNKGRLCAEWETGIKQARGVAMAPDGFILAAKDNKIVQLTPEGKESTKWLNLAGATDIQGLTFVGSTLYIADNGTDKVYKATVPTGIDVTTDPLAMAYNGTDTLFLLVDGTPRDKVLLVDPTTGALASSYDAPDDRGEGLTYLGTSLYYASNKDNNRKIYQLNPTTGAELANFFPKDDWGNNMWQELRGLGNDGTDLVLSINNPNDPCVDKIDKSNGNNKGRLCAEWETGIKQAEGVAVAPDGFILAAKDNKIVQLTPEGKENAKWQNLAGVGHIKALTFVSSALYIADDDSNKVYKATVPTGIDVTTDPLAMAYNGTDTLFLLVDGSPRDKVLLVDPTTGALASSYDAPDDKGEGLTYLGTSLYYTSNKDNNRKIYQLNPTTGAELANIFPKDNWGNNMWQELRGLGTDGTDLILSTNDPNDACFDKIDKSNGDNKERLCADFNTGIKQAEGVAVAADGSILTARDNKIAQLTPDGKEFAKWLNLVGVGHIKALTFVGSVLYVADTDTDTVFKATIPSGITTDPRGLAYNGTDTLFVLVDAAPNDHILLVNPVSGALVDSYDAPDSRGQGLTYMGTSLYYAGRDDQGRLEIRKLDPANGNTLSTIQPRYDWGGEIWEDPRSLSNDGTNLLLVFGNNDCIDKIDKTNGDNEGRLCPGEWGTGLLGARGMSTASDGTIFSARNGEVAQLTVAGQGNFKEIARWTTAPALDVQGLAFIDDTLYLADDSSNTIFNATKPSGITNSPRGLAYDGAYLYILVDGSLVDHVIVVDSENGAVVRDFDAPSRDTLGITYLGSFLYVTASSDIPGQGMQRAIYKISPIDGTVISTLNSLPGDFSGKVTGLASSSSSLIGVQDHGMFALFMDPAIGSFQKRVDFYDGGFIDGFDALAYHAGSKDLFATRAGSIYRFDDDGRKLGEFATVLTKLEGMVLVGEVVYLAEAQGNTIQAASIPLPPTTVTTSPKGMATDGTSLYLVVDGSPKDRILVLSANPGEILRSYGAPGDNTDSLAWHGGSLYAVTNEYHPNWGQQPPRVFKLDPTTGATLEEYNVQSPWGGVLFGEVRGLASDGTYLYVGMNNEPGWFRFNPANPSVPATRTNTFSPSIPIVMSSFQAMEVAEALSGQPRLLVSGYATQDGTGTPGQAGVLAVSRFNKETGEMLDRWEMGTTDIKGMAYIGTVLYLADATSETVLATSLPENIPEITTVGDYQATLEVEYEGITLDSSPAAEFSLVRNTDPQVEITSPAPNFSTVNDVTTINGRVSDPSIKQVFVGVDLPFTSLLEDSVTPEHSGGLWDAQGMWYVSCLEWQQDRPFPKNASSPCSWRYGQQGQFPFAPGITTQGSLTAREPILIGPGTKISFQTWYDAEPVPDRDLKRMEIAEVTVDVDGNEVVGEFRTLLQIVGRGFGQVAPPPNAAPGFRYVEVEQARIDFDPQSGLPVPEFTGVGVDMTTFQGKRLLIRFKFNSVNKFANEGFGWFLDDIVVSGAGFKGELIPVTPLDPPVVDGDVVWFSQFTQPLTLADGPNTVKAVGELPYPPKPNGPRLTGHDQVSGFLDRVAPWVTLGGIEYITAQPVQTLTGGVDDMNFDFMEVTQTNVFGTQTIYSINALPGDGSFSVPVSLLEGENVFEATALDQSDLTSTTAFTVYLDTQGPTLTPLETSYPVGAVSARAGDLAIIQVTASDEWGIQRVFVTNPDGAPEDMVPSSDIPEAVLDQWGVTGGWVLPIEIPAVAPPGAYTLTVTALDKAQNATVGTVQALVVATLEGFTFNLMPGSNLVSLPLIPDTTGIVELLGPEVLEAVDTIMYYDASRTDLQQEDRWLMFSPDAPAEVNTLTDLTTGRGYWFKMKSDAFSFSEPLAPGLPPTPRPIAFSYTGVFLEEATVPSTYPVVPGWNLVGFHSELVLPVTTGLQSLESPQRVWASLYQYDNQIRFELEQEPEIILGGFRRVLPTGEMEPGRGYWLYMVESGTIVP